MPNHTATVVAASQTGQTPQQSSDHSNASNQEREAPTPKTDALVSDTARLATPDTPDTPAAPPPQPDILQPPALLPSSITPTSTDTAATSNPTNTDGQARSLGQALNDAFEALDTQVSYWNANNIQRASLNLQDGQAQALRIEVTLQDGQAQLEFHTNDNATREALRQNAETALRPLLESHGLELGSWSIGAQTAGQGGTSDRQPAPPPVPHPSEGSRQGTHARGQNNDPVPAPATRRTSQRPGGIDLYA